MSVDNVSDIEPRVQYTAAAAQTDFDYPFPIFVDADLVVDIDGVTQALTTDYTVTGAGDDAGGTVTLLVAATGGEVVTIYRDIAIERLTDFQQNGRFSSASFNDELDKMTMIMQQLESNSRLALRFPKNASTSVDDLELSPVASWLGKAIKIDENGVPVPLTLTEGTVADLATRQVFTATAGQTTFTVAGGYTVGAVDVFQNGAKLVAAEDFTAVNGSTVVLATGASASDRIDITAWSINPSYLPNYYGITTAEGAAGVTPTSYAYLPGDIRRYGATSSACSTALTAAIAQAAAGAPVYIPTGNWTQDVAVAVPAGVEIRGDGVGSVLIQSTTNTSNLTVGVANVTIRGVHFQGAADVTTTGRIALSAATRCTIEDCWFSAHAGWGIHSSGASVDCAFRRNRFYGWASPINGSAAINVYNELDTFTISDNIIDCGSTSSSTGADFGISVLRSAGTGTFKNLSISNNRIERCREYGITVYANTDTTANVTISGNTIDYVYGSTDNDSTGSGIYLLRPGNTTVTGNSIGHTNISTADPSSLAPGAIGVNAAYGTLVIANNTIDTPTQSGVYLVSGAATSSIVVSGNAVYSPGKIGIYAYQQSNVKITGNTVITTAATAGIGAIRSLGLVGTHIENISVIGNQILAAGDDQIILTYTDDAVFSNNNIEMTDTSGIAVTLSACDRAVISGNVIKSDATSGVALLLSAVTAGRVTGNYLLCNHSSDYYGTTGTCTGTFADESNGLSRASNAGTGSNVTLRVTAIPSAGTYIAGDRAWDTDAAAGATPGWVCTTGGTSGTWKAMASLAA